MTTAEVNLFGEDCPHKLCDGMMALDTDWKNTAFVVTLVAEDNVHAVVAVASCSYRPANSPLAKCMPVFNGPSKKKKKRKKEKLYSITKTKRSKLL